MLEASDDGPNSGVPVVRRVQHLVAPSLHWKKTAPPPPCSVLLQNVPTIHGIVGKVCRFVCKFLTHYVHMVIVFHSTGIVLASFTFVPLGVQG